jgi:hypothetical protein
VGRLLPLQFVAVAVAVNDQDNDHDGDRNPGPHNEKRRPNWTGGFA